MMTIPLFIRVFNHPRWWISEGNIFAFEESWRIVSLKKKHDPSKEILRPQDMKGIPKYKYVKGWGKNIFFEKIAMFSS